MKKQLYIVELFDDRTEEDGWEQDAMRTVEATSPEEAEKLMEEWIKKNGYDYFSVSYAHL